MPWTIRKKKNKGYARGPLWNPYVNPNDVMGGGGREWMDGGKKKNDSRDFSQRRVVKWRELLRVGWAAAHGIT